MVFLALLPFISTAAGVTFTRDFRPAPMARMRTFERTYLHCYVNDTTKLDFNIVLKLHDAADKELFRTQLIVNNGEARIASSYESGNDFIEVFDELAEGYTPYTNPSGGYPIVNVVLLSNETHMGFGSCSVLAEEMKIPFKVEQVERILLKATGKNMMGCQEGLGCGWA